MISKSFRFKNNLLLTKTNIERTVLQILKRRHTGNPLNFHHDIPPANGYLPFNPVGNLSIYTGLGPPTRCFIP